MVLSRAFWKCHNQAPVTVLHSVCPCFVILIRFAKNSSTLFTIRTKCLKVMALLCKCQWWTVLSLFKLLHRGANIWPLCKVLFWPIILTSIWGQKDLWEKGLRICSVYGTGNKMERMMVLLLWVLWLVSLNTWTCLILAC
jgi:hypothetical protein